MFYSHRFRVQQLHMYKVCYRKAFWTPMIFLFSSSSLYIFCLSSCLIRVYRMSFPNPAHCIYPFPNFVFGNRVGVGLGRINFFRQPIFLCCSILFHFILEAEVGLWQPILEKYSFSFVNQIDQTRMDLESSRAYGSFPNFKI